MKKQNLFLALAFLTMTFSTYSQNDVTKETVTKDGVTNNITVTNTGMYNGTKSKKAGKYYEEAAEYALKGNNKKAIKTYLKCIKEDKNFVEAYDNVGRLYRKIGDYNNAIKFYKKSMKLYPEGIMAHQNLATVYGIQKEYKKAIKEYKTILKIDDMEPEGYFGLANSYFTLKKYDLALKNAKKALKLYQETNSPHETEGYYLIGIINYYKGDKTEAQKYFTIAKDRGMKLHSQLIEEFFTEEETEEEEEAEIKLETDEDFAKYESTIIKIQNWLIETPVNKEKEMRDAYNSFLIQWVTGAPKVTIVLSDKIVTYMDCGDCLTIFMGGWAKYSLESQDFTNNTKGALAGTQDVITFYKKNKKELGKNKNIEKLIKLQNKNKLESFIKSNL